MDKAMSRAKVFMLLHVLASLGAGGALAEKVEWSLSSYPFLEARSTESESDASLRAQCAPGNRVILSFGAPATPGFMGEGEGESMSVMLESAGKTASVKGISKQSVDSELTGGIELATDVSLDDPLFDVLSTGKPVMIVKADGMKEALTEGEYGEGADAVKQFVKACGGE